ncbi:fatty acid synthase-like [Anopheles arabiensis]|uniref:fatty acid synthase-like n=1 Tax=Anopheles arabiensis TaxID=7173 RepID=UPI001AAD0E93|nr:fatty acid synthase-like [Anopheles arabiensis]XP_061518498.1 fatty acid synthase [Anopheles gambiae]
MHPSTSSTSSATTAAAAAPGTKCTPITADDSIVISGIAGKYPRSDSVEHFADNLYNKVDLVDDKEDRWRHLYAGIPKRLGKLNKLGKFDAEFFGSGFQETHTMDPQQRLLLEHCYEALLDAGLHPDDIRGTRTGVFVGVSIAETEIYWTYKKTKSPYNRSILGFVRSMLATKIAYALDLKGPSMAVDTACSSSMYALDWACKAIRQGQCDAAIVAGTNLTLHPYITLQFALLGVLAADGYCRPFDKNASGYSRSEANAVILLQKAKDAKRIYAHVVNTKTNCDGYKLEGITFPSNKIQKQLLDELYSEVPYDPKDISYVEAHSTGTVVGDPEECDAIEKVFCPDRTEPLLVGSVKSNIGHSEAAAGICSVTKCVIAMQNRIIPPNINYTEPRTDVPSLLNGKLKVVDQCTPLGGPLVAVNSFGFGGANAHALLHNCTKQKINGGYPKDGLPRLVVWSGRTIEAVDHFLDSLKGKSYDAEFYALTHNIQRSEIPKMTTKGYAIFGGRQDGTAELLYKAASNKIPKKYKLPPVTLAFGQLEGNWKATVQAFNQFPEFANGIAECLQAIKDCGFDAFDQTMQANDPIQHILWTFMAQVGVYRLLTASGVTIDQYAGYAVGQITCAYLDGVLSLHDALRVAYAHGYIIRAHHTEKSANYGSGVSSNKQLTVKLATALKPLRLQAATPKWFNPCQLKTFEMYDPKVMTTLFHTLGANEAIVLQPLNASKDVLMHFLKSLGEVFLKGHPVNLLPVYPTIQFPVSQGTGMISSLLEWDHSADWHVTNFRTTRMVDQSTSEYTISLSEQDYISGHCIDGRILIPATGYLFYVWDSFSGRMGIIPEEMPVEFSDIEFLRATTLVGDQQVTLTVDLNEVTGSFEVSEGTALVVKGRIQALTNYTPPETKHRQSDAVMMPSKDFYKELRLRGYHYGGYFKSVMESRTDGSYAKIEWKYNWTALLDCILQVAIIAVDSRSLVIPTRIESIKIDPIQHKLTDQATGNEVPSYNVCFDPDLNLLQCGAIEIRGLNASTIARRLPPGVPVLESYKFHPYYPQHTMAPSSAVSTIVQTILENQATIFFTVTEIHSKTKDPIISLFGDAIGDLPLVKAHLTLLSTAKPEPIPNVTISEDKLMKQRNVLLLICENLFADDEFISDAINCLSDQGFILLRESPEYRLQDGHRRLQLVSTMSIEGETFLLLQQKKSAMNTSVDAHVIKVCSNDTTHNWLLELKQEVKTKPVILYAQNDRSSGIIGLVNCIRKEPNIQTVSCFFIDDPTAPAFDASNPFYKEQIELGLAINVYREGQWGSYRHFKLQEEPRYEPATKHCFANCVKPGDLSSFTWMVGPLSEQPPSSPLARVVYSSLNFKDVMIATGRLTVETFCTDRLQQECILGFEYSGVTTTGKRVMGIIGAGSMATIVETDPIFTLDVPDNISLEQAATIPTVYTTVYASFFVCAQIRKGNSILIHAGTGGVGLAAIRVCLAYGLEVFTTVSTKEKRDFLLSYFPDLNPNNIGNSRDISFETLIKERTNGRGVDFVLNSLSEEKLQASIRCLARGGHFLEIGKYDMMKDSKIAMTFFQRGITFTAVLVDLLFQEKRDLLVELHKLIMKDLAKGIIQPLPTTVFQAHEIEQAFRYLATAKHIGKVVLKIRDNEDDLASVPISYLPRVYCNPEQTFVIAGGLGGFGLELADWLIIRGCRKLLLSSSRGITKPYQQYRINTWRTYGVQVTVSTEDISTYDGCRRLLQQAIQMGPIAGIFNLAVQLRDAIIENQSVDKFAECLAPKATATHHLDALSRELCPMLKHFVVFSSVSCGRGNAGQSNYGMANSIMERIIEHRVVHGLPGKAIQWGAIGEVGIVADMQEDKIDMEIGGTLQQRLSSCIQVLDQLLTTSEPIVASMVVAEKRSSSGGAKNIVEAVMNIMNIRDMKSVSVESTLADIGMDSLMAVEIRQVLERDFDIILTPQDLRTLTFSKLQKLADAKTESETAEATTQQLQLQDLLASFGDETASHHTVLRLPSKCNDLEYDRPVLIIPGIESVSSPAWTKIASEINAPTFVLQTFAKGSDEQTIPGIVDSVFEEMFETVFAKAEQFLVIGYSFGALLALEVVKRLEARPLRGKLMLIDGSPLYLQRFASHHLSGFDDEHLQMAILTLVLRFSLPSVSNEILSSIMGEATYENRVTKMLDIGRESNPFSEEYTRKMMRVLLFRLKAAMNMSTEVKEKLASPLVLVRSGTIGDIEEDYGLTEFTSSSMIVKIIDGTHQTMLANMELLEIINKDTL